MLISQKHKIQEAWAKWKLVNISILLNLTQTHIPQEIQFWSQSLRVKRSEIIVRQLSDRAPNQEIFTKSVGWFLSEPFAFYIHHRRTSPKRPPTRGPHNLSFCIQTDQNQQKAEKDPTTPISTWRQRETAGKGARISCISSRLAELTYWRWFCTVNELPVLFRWTVSQSI